MGSSCFDLIRFSLDFLAVRLSVLVVVLLCSSRGSRCRGGTSRVLQQHNPRAALWCRARSPELCSPIISGDPIRSRREELLSCSGCASISGVQFSHSFSFAIPVASRPTTGCSLRCSISQVERSGLQGQQIRFSAAWSSSDFFSCQAIGSLAAAGSFSAAAVAFAIIHCRSTAAGNSLLHQVLDTNVIWCPNL